MATAPEYAILIAAWGLVVLLFVGSLLWNRPLNQPVFQLPFSVLEGAVHQQPFTTRFADQYELWVEFATAGRSANEWKRLFGFGVPPVAGVAVPIKWEVLDDVGGSIVAAGEIESTDGNSFSGGTVGRRLALVRLPKGRLHFRASVSHGVPALAQYPASLRLQLEPTTAHNWRFIPYWGGPYLILYVFVPLLIVASIVVLYRAAAA